MSFRGLTKWLGLMMGLFAGGFLAVATYGFSVATAVTLGFAVSIGIVVLGLAGIGLTYVRGERLVNGVLSAALVLIGGWTIAATYLFSDATARWWTFAAGLAYAGICAIGLAIHEVTTERVVHHLEVEERKPAEIAH